MALYQRNHLSLPLPNLEPTHTGKVISVLDGASDIGMMAVQLAVASGTKVIATASKNNIALVKSLGANIVIQQDPLAYEELKSALGMGKIPIAGVFDTMSSDESFDQIDKILDDIQQSPPVCATKPPTKPPKLFAPSIGIHTLYLTNSF